MRLFDRPFDLDAIDRDLQQDGFHQVIFIVLGRSEAAWRDGLRETAELLEEVECQNRDWRPVYRLVGTVMQRAEMFENSIALLDEMVSTLGLLPGTNFFEDVKLARLSIMDPHAFQRHKNREWVERYRAHKGYS